MSCGLTHALIVTFGGKIYGIGNNEEKQLVLNNNQQGGHISIPTLSEWRPDVSVIKVSCGYRHTHLLDENGHVWGVGTNASGALGLGHESNKNEQK